MRSDYTTSTGCRGFNLVELMIGMVIGLIVLGAVSSVYLSARQTARTNDALARMQESGRLAMDLLADHVAHAGYYGPTIFSYTITGQATSPAFVNYTLNGSDCGLRWVTNLNQRLLVSDNVNPYSTTCIVDVTTGTNRWNWLPNTDVLTLRNVDTIPIPNANLTDGRLYIRGDVNQGTIFFGNTPPPIGNYAANSVSTNELRAYAYYVANFSFDSGATFVPALMRVRSEGFGTDIRLTNEFITAGIEDIQVEVGADTTGNGDADTWGPATAGTDFDRVSAIRIWLLIRSEEADRTFNPQLAATTYTLANTPIIRSDQFRRTVMVKTIRLRNINQMGGI